MDFVVIPSNRSSFGLPQVKGRSWLSVLLLVQLLHLVTYKITTKQHLRWLDDPFGCGDFCIPPSSIVMLDWFISSLSILLPMITDELVLEQFVYFSFHYIYFIRLFLLYRVLLLLVLLPSKGLPAGVLLATTVFHFTCIAILLRIFYVLLKEIEKSRNNLIAVQLTFRYLISMSIVKVYRSIDGDSVSIAPMIGKKTVTAFSDVCPICYECLAIGSQRNVTSVSRSRVNAAINRPLSYGKLNVFTTSCQHAFHRDCIMKV